MNNKRKTGAEYEKKAAEYLEKQGYDIVTHNYYTHFGEIDLIAQKEGILVFIEVKYRKNLSKGYPQEAVSKEKQRKIMKSAEVYLYRNKMLHRPCRFDVIVILDEQLKHIINAFEG